MMNSEIGFCKRVLEVFADNNISIEHMPSGIDTMTIFVHQDEFEEKEQKVIEEIDTISKRGNSAEVKKDKDGNYVVYEVQKKRKKVG